MAEDIQGVFNDLVAGLDKCTTALYYAADAFNNSKSSSSLGSSSKRSQSYSSGKKSLDSTLKDAEKMFDRSSKNSTQVLTMQQKIFKTFVTSLQAVGRVFIQEFKSSVNRVSSDYLSNLEKITVRMQLSNTQYAGLYNEYASKIYREFKGAFSVQDFSNSLVTALDTGLREKEAEDIAYRNMITNKLVPAISTNTREYTRNSKLLGDRFSRGVTAMYKHIESTLKDTTGLDEGQTNNIIDTLSTNIKYLSHGDQEIAVKQLESVMAGHAVLSDQVGVDAADETLQLLDNILDGKLDSIAAMEVVGGTGDDLKKKVQSGDFDLGEFYQSMQAQIQGYFNSDNPSVIEIDKVSEALGVSADYVKNVLSAKHYREQDLNAYNEVVKKYNRESTYGKELENLEQGYYISADDYFSKMIDNNTTWFSTLKSNITRFDTHFALITTILSTIATNMFFTKTKGGQSILNGIMSIFGKGNTSGQIPGQQMLSGFGGTTAGAGGSLINFAAGPLALFAGGAMAVKDAWDAGKKHKEAGADAGTVVDQAAKASLTGHADMTNDEKLQAAQDALSGQRRKMNWKEVGSNTAKGALIGTGVGTAVGGWAAGLGTVIGAGVGAISGAVTNMIDQAVENAKYNKLADAVNAFDEALVKTNQAMSNYEIALDKRNKTEELLNKMKSGDEKQQSVALKQLKEQYITTLSTVKDINDWDEKYVGILMDKVNNEAKLAGKEVLGGIGDLISEGQEIIEGSTDLSSGDVLNKTAYEFIEAVANDYTLMNNREDFNKLLNEKAEEAGTTVGHFAHMVNQASGQDLIGHNKKNNTFYGLGTVSSRGIYNDRYTKARDAYEKDEYGVFKKGTSDETKKKISDDAIQLYNIIDKTWEEINKYASNQFVEEEGIYDFSEISDSELENFKFKIKDFDKMAQDYNQKMLARGLEDRVTEDLFTNYVEIKDALQMAYDRFGGTYQTGSYNIGNDQIAQLHAGEMVLTSANADKLRSIESSGGISGLLSGLLGLTKVKATPIDNSTSIDPVTSAITHQTEILSDLLSRILEAITGIRQVSNPTITTPVSVSNDLITFRGA